MKNQKQDIIIESENFVDKSVHQKHNESKPVGYGSSIQNSGHGNRTRPQEVKDEGAETHETEEKKDL